MTTYRSFSAIRAVDTERPVDHEVAGKAYRYFSLLALRGTLKSLVRDFVTRVFDGAAGEFLLHGIEVGKLSPEELDRLEETVRKAKQRQKRERGT